MKKQMELDPATQELKDSMTKSQQRRFLASVFRSVRRANERRLRLLRVPRKEWPKYLRNI